MNTLPKSSEILLEEFQQRLLQAKSIFSNPLQQSEAAIPVCAAYLQELKKLLRKFRNLPRDQEIYFFKEVKPKFVSEYLYNTMVYRLHFSWPMADVKKQQAYLETNINQINQFFEENHQFYAYYRRNSTHLDNTYFVRWQQDTDPTTEHLFSDSDPSFNTSRDILLGKILANTLFQEYLVDQLHILVTMSTPATRLNGKPALVWSESKSAFMELVYGLHLSNAFNGGKTDIKTLVLVLGKQFGVEIKNYYDFFQHIKMRKIEPTKFTDRMKACLLQKFSNDFDSPAYT